MAKNKKLLNSLSEVAKRNIEKNVMAASERDTPQIYSALAIALWNMLDMPENEKADAINDIFVESQKVWSDCIDKGIDIEKMCVDITGIFIGGKQNE